MENNIFSPVVLEPAVDPEANAVLASVLVLVFLPATDSDIKGCGLNQ